ncbi:MAG: sugar ABC transporter permease [Candidatus Marinimicrobia bacterium]|nr:sugar ABC transporter permease [Candidatus Neomarinimicrobiota bacterium]
MIIIVALTIQKRDQLFGVFLTLPGLATLLIIILFPIIFTIITSFYDYTLLNPHHDSFVGLDNYQEVIEEDYIGDSVLITSQFVLSTVLIEFFIGFIIALSLNKVKRFKTVYYVILLAPLMINPVVVGLIWRMILHTELGIFNYLLKLLNINRVNWLGDNDTAFWTIVFVDIWHQVSFMTILLLAGLSALPREPYEAARMDGASSLRCLISITLPLMRPVITVAILLRLIFSIKTFDIIYIMTKGGPGISTDLVSYFIYRSAFFGLDIGRASALSVGLLIIVLFLTFFLYKYMRSLN